MFKAGEKMKKDLKCREGHFSHSFGRNIDVLCLQFPKQKSIVCMLWWITPMTNDPLPTQPMPLARTMLSQTAAGVTSRGGQARLGQRAWGLPCFWNLHPQRGGTTNQTGRGVTFKVGQIWANRRANGSGRGQQHGEGIVKKEGVDERQSNCIALSYTIGADPAQNCMVSL